MNAREFFLKNVTMNLYEMLDTYAADKNKELEQARQRLIEENTRLVRDMAMVWSRMDTAIPEFWRRNGLACAEQICEGISLLERRNSSLYRTAMDALTMQKVIHVVPKRVTFVQAMTWWKIHSPRFLVRDHRGDFAGYNTEDALKEFANHVLENLGIDAKREPEPPPEGYPV